MFCTAVANDEAEQAFSADAAAAASDLPLSNGMEPTAADAFSAVVSTAEQITTDGGNWGQQYQQWDGQPAADPGAAANADGGYRDTLQYQYQQSEQPNSSEQWQQQAAAPLTEVWYRHTIWQIAHSTDVALLRSNAGDCLANNLEICDAQYSQGCQSPCSLSPLTVDSLPLPLACKCAESWAAGEGTDRASVPRLAGRATVLGSAAARGRCRAARAAVAAPCRQPYVR